MNSVSSFIFFIFLLHQVAGAQKVTVKSAIKFTKSDTINSGNTDSLRLRIKGLEQEIASTKTSSEGGEKAIAKLRDSLEALRKDVAYYKRSDGEQKELSDSLRLLLRDERRNHLDAEKLKDQVDKLKKQNEDYVNELERIKNDNTTAKLQKRYDSLYSAFVGVKKSSDAAMEDVEELKKRAAENEKDRKETIAKMEPLLKENEHLSTFLFGSFEKDVKRIISELNRDNLSTVRPLLQRGVDLEKQFPDATSLKRNIEQLKDYDRLATAIDNAKKTLDELYNTKRVSSAIQALEALPVENIKAELNTAVENYKGLLTQYCTADKQYSERMWIAVGADPNRSKIKLKEAADFLVNEFTYLKRDLEEKKKLIEEKAVLAAKQKKVYEESKNRNCN